MVDLTTWRPLQSEYDRALDLYRTNAGHEAIAEALGWTEEQVERLVEVGWPAGAEGQPALPRLRAAIQDRIVRVRAAELDVIQHHAEAVGRSASARTNSIVAAAQIENAIMTSWAEVVASAMKMRPKLKDGASIQELRDFTSSLLLPKAALDNLARLRAMQVADVEAAAIKIFARSASRGPDGAESSLEDQIYGDLAEMTPEEQDEWVRTKQKPTRQLELPMTRTEDA